jgi:HEXXH motif-containing protein
MIAEIVNPPLEAIALPGAGRAALDRLMSARAVYRIIALHHASQQAPTQASALAALVDYLVALSPEDAKLLLGDARVGGAIARVLSAVVGRDTLLARRISVLPAHIHALSERVARDWNVILSPSEELPLDAEMLVRNIASDERRVRLDELCDAVGLAREERIRITDLQIELFDPRDVPELSERRLPEERESDLSWRELEAELDRAFDAIHEAWPEAMEDVRTFFRGLLAMKMPAERWNSASTGEYPGVLQLTLRRGGEPLLLAESILHESAHAKLDIAMGLQPLLVDDGVRRYRHPWRPDLRPITGVLLGAHAFLAVLEFYRRVARSTGDPLAKREVETREREVGTALDLLDREGAFTSAGRSLLDQMREAYFGGHRG